MNTTQLSCAYFGGGCPGVILLKGRNRSCPHCFRRDLPGKNSDRLRYDQFLTGLGDMEFVVPRQPGRMYLSGGEPTIWRDGDRQVTELLAEMCERGFAPGLVTNGSAFTTRDATREFFDAYFARGGQSINVVVSVDVWHDNLDQATNGCISLDNVLHYGKEHPERGRLIDLDMEWTVSTRVEHLPPAAFVSCYEAQRVDCIVFALCYSGWQAREFEMMSPKLVANSADKSTLGAFSPYLASICKQRGLIERESEFARLSNEAIMDRCTAKTFLFCDGVYYFCPNHAGSGYFKIGDLGAFSEEAFREWLDTHPAAQRLLRSGPITVMRESCPELSRNHRRVIDEILETAHQFGISTREGCGVCKSMLEAGLFDEIDEMLMQANVFAEGASCNEP